MDNAAEESMEAQGETSVDEEDTGADLITEPFDPARIRIETRALTVDIFVKRIADGRIDLSPAFQRLGDLWKPVVQSRLIESLLVRIPIPAFYIDATDEDRWQVVDGLQRLSALRNFVIGRTLRLQDLEFLKQDLDGRAFNGKSWDELTQPMKRRIEETQVSAYLIQPGTPDQVKFNVFKRINTGGLPLSAQEIRHALNQGPATDMLKRLAASPEFVAATAGGIHDRRMTDRECALRFLAFVITPYTDYKSQDLDGFLHAQMKTLNRMKDPERATLEERFLRSMEIARDVFGRDAFRKRYQVGEQRKPINKALFEAWSVNLDALTDDEADLVVERRDRVIGEFLARLRPGNALDLAVTQGTGDASKVRVRFEQVRDLLRAVLV